MCLALGEPPRMLLLNKLLAGRPSWHAGAVNLNAIRRLVG